MKRGMLQIVIGILFVMFSSSACKKKVELPSISNSNSETNVVIVSVPSQLARGVVGNVFDTNSSIVILPQELLGLNSNAIAKMEQVAEGEKGLDAAIKLTTYYLVVNYDVEKEIKYLKIAAAQGHVPSQYNLGVIYSEEPKVRDMTKAKYWFSVAAKSGNADAKISLKALDGHK